MLAVLWSAAPWRCLLSFPGLRPVRLVTHEETPPFSYFHTFWLYLPFLSPEHCSSVSRPTLLRGVSVVRYIRVRHLIASILQHNASSTTVDPSTVGIIPLRMTVRESFISSFDLDEAPASIAGHKAQTTLASSATKPSRELWRPCDADRRAVGRLLVGSRSIRRQRATFCQRDASDGGLCDDGFDGDGIGADGERIQKPRYQHRT
jgi:hypothetical protein